MPNLNRIMLMGRAARDLELKYTPKGTAITAFGLAINRHYTLENGEKKEDVTFVDVEAYGKQAETLAKYCSKGKPLYVEGRLKLDQWDDKTSGQKRSKMKVIVENFQLLGSRGESADSAPGSPAHVPRPPADPDLDAAPDDIPF